MPKPHAIGVKMVQQARNQRRAVAAYQSLARARPVHRAPPIYYAPGIPGSEQCHGARASTPETDAWAQLHRRHALRVSRAPGASRGAGLRGIGSCAPASWVMRTPRVKRCLGYIKHTDAQELGMRRPV